MKKLILLILCTVPMIAGAQRLPVTESNYAAAERFTFAKLRQMAYSSPVEPKWLELSDRFWYTYRTSEGTRWWIVDARRGTKRPLFDNHYMASEISRVTKDPYDEQNLPVGNIRFTADEKAFRFTVDSKFEEVPNPDADPNEKDPKKKLMKRKFVFEYNLESGRLKHLEGYETQKLPDWGCVSPDGKTVVYTKNYDLWMMDRANFDKAIADPKDTTLVETRLTFDGVKGFGFGPRGSKSNDKIDTLRRGRAPIAWAPDSKHFAYTKVDNREVGQLWVIENIARPRPVLNTFPYQMPGEKNAPQYYLYLFDVAAREQYYVETWAFKDQIMAVLDDEPKRDRHDDYTIVSPVWMGSENEFFFERMSRDGRRIDFCRVNTQTLEVKTVIEERSNFYLTDQQIKLTGGAGSDIIHWSEEDGWAHLYLYNWEGERISRITDGPWHVDQVVDVDPRAKVIYFTANGREKETNPYFNFLYRVNFDGSGLRLLTPGDYSHNVVMDENSRFFVENVTRIDAVPYSVLRNAAGREVMRLEQTDMSGLFAAGYKFPTRFKVKAADGVTDLYGTLYLPYDLDSTRLYPVIEYVYPGPQQEGVMHTYHLPSVSLDRLAQLGFVVVTVGNRGGDPHRSKWYHTYGSGNLRDYAIADKKAAAIQLADRYPFMDLSRVGITGHSGGGFLSTAAILQYPDFYKVAVSCAGNHDNSIYNRGWGELHHGVKEEVNDKGDTTFVFKVPNNQELARNLKGRLLLVTGDVDNNVHPANTILVVNDLIKAGKRFDMLVLPGQEHQFGDMNEYFFWRMADYFTLWLMGDRRERPVDIPQLRE
jgi:dipeptidyl aminopeptidase/acylaminoacyl peptidase